MSNFGEWLAEELARRHWTQADLTRRSGLPSPTLSRIISGERGAGRKSLARIAAALEYPVGVVAEAAGMGAYRNGDSPALVRLVEVARALSDADLDELTHLALYKHDRK